MDSNVTVFGPFSLAVSDAGIAVAVFDVPGEKQNILRERYIADGDAMLDLVERESSIVGLVFESGKQESFIAGADVRMLADCQTAGEAAALSKSAQTLFGRLEALQIPVVAAIQGACLGGGLELALACHARICSDDAKTVVGLPEVRLGLLPGSGGTQRLPRLIGLKDALQMMLTGRPFTAHDALKLGVVDEVVPQSILRQTAIQCVLRLRERGGARIERRNVGERLLESNSIGRSLIISKARKTSADKTGGHYPAPAAIIDCVEIGTSEGMEEGLRVEAAKFGELAQTSQARALMSLFLASSELKSETGAPEGVVPRPVTHVGVLGAGLMGAGIAFVSSYTAGLNVRLKDREHSALAAGLRYIAKRVDKMSSRNRLAGFDRQTRLDRVTTTLTYSGFEKVAVVFEAVFEDAELKRQILAEIETVSAEPDLIFATNTSSIPVAAIAAGARRPENVIGMHYFSPVERMPLLEVVVAEKTSDQAVATAVELGKRQGKTVIIVRDGPGFYVNRILAPYLNEATLLLVEGVGIEAVDAAIRRFGFPLGPFELMDEVGLDVVSKVIPVLEAALGESIKSSGVVEAMVADGRLGKKAGRGFYAYSSNGKRHDAAEDVGTLLDLRHSNGLRENEIQNRCVLMMIQESVRCLVNGVIRNARDGDVGAVFGIGFPPFLGGPFRYADQVGASAIVARLRGLSSDVGRRFEPHELLVKMSEDGSAFHLRERQFP